MIIQTPLAFSSVAAVPPGAAMPHIQPAPPRSVAELAAEADQAEQALVAASIKSDRCVLGREPTAAEIRALDKAHEADLRAFRAAMAAKAQSADDIRLQIDLVKRRYDATLADPDDGIFALLDGVLAFVSRDERLAA